jgi:hypothetical protein
MGNSRFIVTSWHGEHGSMFYVIDTDAISHEQPCIIFCDVSKKIAEDFAKSFNKENK